MSSQASLNCQSSSLNNSDFKDTVYNFSDQDKKINQYLQSLTFKPRQAGAHYRKHKNELKQYENSTKYLEGARKTIHQTVMDRGFALAQGQGVAFFHCPSKEENFPEPNGCPGLFTVVTYTERFATKISTHYYANGKTPGLTLVNFQKQGLASRKDSIFVARFSKGKSTGWVPYNAVKDWGSYYTLKKADSGAGEPGLHSFLDIFCLE